MSIELTYGGDADQLDLDRAIVVGGSPDGLSVRLYPEECEASLPIDADQLTIDGTV